MREERETTRRDRGRRENAALRIGPDPDLIEALERARSGVLPSVPAARRQHPGKRSSIVGLLVGRDHDGPHELRQ